MLRNYIEEPFVAVELAGLTNMGSFAPVLALPVLIIVVVPYHLL